MKDEIKEILEALKPQDEEFTKAGIKEYPLVLSVKEQKILLDYITNLQEENSEQLDESLKLSEWLVKKQKRIEKAIEYCRLNKEFTPRLVDIENILNGGDE